MCLKMMVVPLVPITKEIRLPAALLNKLYIFYRDRRDEQQGYSLGETLDIITKNI